MGTLLSDVKWQHTGKFGRIKYNADSGKGCTTENRKNCNERMEKQGDYLPEIICYPAMKF